MKFSFGDEVRKDEIQNGRLIYRADPDLEFEGLLKRQHTRVKYFQGSLMNAMDLERAKVKFFDRLHSEREKNGFLLISDVCF